MLACIVDEATPSAKFFLPLEGSSLNTVERALHVLIHDIRTPVGVAQGYLRLIREDRLTAADERTKAIDQAQKALDLVSRLCHDAAALVEQPPEVNPVAVPADRFAGQVRERLQREPVDLAQEAASRPGSVAVPGDADRLADAVVKVLLSIDRDRAGRQTPWRWGPATANCGSPAARTGDPCPATRSTPGADRAWPCRSPAGRSPMPAAGSGPPVPGALAPGSRFLSR